MEEDKKLYPFKFIIIDENPEEDVLLADLGYQDSMVREGWLAANGISEVMDTYMDRVVGDYVFGRYGRQFPVMVKIIKGDETTPLMVCPDDEIAAERLDFLGKAKLWYIDAVEPGAKIYLGFNKDIPAEEFYMACRHNQVEEFLNAVEPKPGEHYLIKPGLVHAAGKGVKITEIAECSPLDFRLHNWGREIAGDEFDAELNLEAAFDFIDYGKYEVSGMGRSNTFADREEFNIRRIKLSEATRVGGDEADGFVLYTCQKGEASLQILTEVGPVNYTVSAGECILVPAEIQSFFLLPVLKNTILLEITVTKSTAPDPYINPDVAPRLENELPDDAEDEDYSNELIFN